KVARWRKIAEEASRQSGRSVIPVVHEPVDFKFFIKHMEHFERNVDTVKRRHGEIKGFIFWEEGGLSLNDAIRKLSPSPIHRFTASPLHLIIGPEGGFTKEEVTLAKEKGLLTISLGKRILRAETAAISAVTLIQFLLGDMG
ncbi:MAG: RsmE family RNA methyltransferase, partial [Nitrospirota bacterium]